MTDIEGNLDLLAPGDRRDLSFDYENLGSLSMDTRITYALSYELNEEVADVIENDLDKVATLTIGDEKLVLDSDNTEVRGAFESGTLKGTQEDIGEAKLSQVLEFHFDESVGNIGQLMTFNLDILVEGKQNRNNPTWEQIHKTTIKFGDVDTEVVPVSACNVNNEENKVILKIDFGTNKHGYELDFDSHEMTDFLLYDINKTRADYKIELEFKDGSRHVLQDLKLNVNEDGVGQELNGEIIREYDLTSMFGDKASEVEEVYINSRVSIRENRTDGIYGQFNDCFSCSNERFKPCSWSNDGAWSETEVDDDGNVTITSHVWLEGEEEC